MKPIYLAAYHQSRFGKLGAVTVPAMIEAAVLGACDEIGAETTQIDVASVAAACNFTLNRQGLLAGLVASVPGLESKPIEAVENACASGGQAVLAVAQKLLLGLGEVGIAVGYEKMRGDDGKVDGARVGEVLGYFSHPDEREGKVYVFPHLFAEIMAEYMTTWKVSEEDLARIAVAEYANARHNPDALMRDVELSLEQAMTIAGPNRYIVEGLPLKTYDSSQITDGYAALILATAEGLARLGVRRDQVVRLAGWAQATDPLRKGGRDVLHPAGAISAMGKAFAMAESGPRDLDVAEIHDCFSVMGAIGVEVLGLALPGGGARYWREGRAGVHGECAINTSGGLIAKGHPIGATGIAMLGWSFRQLLGRAPAPLQRRDARVAATFNIGGPVCASVCTVLRRD
jgi:acetyl-CoA C-acetyltransferase